MKRLILALAAVALLATGAKAQSPEIQIGYGGYTMMDGCDMAPGPKANVAWGAVTAGLNFKVMPNFYMGATYTFSSSDYKHFDEGNIYYNVIMFNGRYDYWRNSLVTLYAHAGLGVDITHASDGDWSETKAYFACQISPLGASFKLSPVTSMFGEIGWGAQGVIQVGLRFRL